MSKVFFLILSIIALVSCVDRACDCESSSKKMTVDLVNHPFKGSIRAIEVLNDTCVWYAGSNGQFGYTLNDGKDWFRDTITINGYHPEFRSIAITDQAVFLLSVASPALLFKSVDNGESWNIVYQEDHPSCFYNSMAFWDDQNGIAVGDPVDNCLSVIITHDGGETWNKLGDNSLPSTVTGEAGFAASNTNISLFGNHAWLVSGGTKARVFHSSDRGLSWEVYDTPISQGEQMTGIFSVDFYDEKNGVIFGGDWNHQEMNSKCKAVTNDGGKTWKLIGEGVDPGFRSCVQYVPEIHGLKMFAVGMPGISFSEDKGESWVNLSTDSFYTIRISESGKVAWLAGKDKITKMTW
ncbi:MAG: hypothetical protein JEZ03_02325 [Bacteroidales bacterium]|nr:hypothetical protein [Bacteroidales bacterium]